MWGDFEVSGSEECRRNGRRAFTLNRAMHVKSLWPLFLVVFLPQRCLQAQKMKIEVVEMVSYVRVDPNLLTIHISAKIILPEGVHATISCTASSRNYSCWKIESFAPEKMPPDSEKCDGDICTTRNLGYFTATRKGNELTVFAPREKLKFTVDGSW